MSKTNLVSFTQSITDFRNSDRLNYPLPEILFLTISAVLSGTSTWNEIVTFGEEKLDWLREYFPYSNGICSHDTLNRVFSHLDYRSFERAFILWTTQDITLSSGTVINLDGKSISRSVTAKQQQTKSNLGGKQVVHLVNAWCNEYQLCIGQYKTDGKTGELTALYSLLDLLTIDNCTVTIDAVACHTDMATKLVKEKNANYLLALKKNQPSLYEETEKLFDETTSFEQTSKTENKNHGREEKRICRVLSSNLLPTSIRKQWTGIASIIEIESHRYVVTKDKRSCEKRYYISSLAPISTDFNTLVRGHWAIENNLHWVLDVQFGEDKSRKKEKNAAQNYGMILKCCLNLLKAHKDKGSMNNKKLKCALSDKYRSNVLK